MDLEQRIQSLEQEVQILRNEIQATLLDIHAHLLTNAHKELRTDALLNEQMNAVNTSAKITAFSINEADNSIEEHHTDTGNVPVLKQVSLNDMQGSSNRPRAHADNGNHRSGSVRQAEAQNHQARSLSDHELEEWAKSKLEELGVQRTRELIYLYHDTGRIDYATSQMLVRLVELYGGKAQTSTKKRKDSDFPFDSVRANSRAKKTPNSTQKRPASTASSGKSARQSQASTRNTQSQRPTSKPAPKSAKPTSANEDDERGLILRLIAGVQSAGIGFGKSGKYQNG